MHQGDVAGSTAQVSGITGIEAADADYSASALIFHEGNGSAGTTHRSYELHVEVEQHVGCLPLRLLDFTIVQLPPNSQAAGATLCRVQVAMLPSDSG